MPYKNPEQRAAYQRLYYLEHCEEIKARSAEHREGHPDHHRRYFREHYQQNRERVSNRVRNYYQQNRDKAMAVAEQWKRDHPKAHAAHHAVERAIRSGRLKRQPCERCGVEKSEAHHDDYEKPLEVQWLCRLHHRRLHSDLRLEAITAPEAVF